MTPRRTLRPALVCLALASVGLMTASCGVMDSPNRFQAMAEKVADIPVDGEPAAERVQTAEEMGLRPAIAEHADTASRGDEPLRVEVMDPHDLWDARDGLRPAMRRAAPAVVEAVAPVVARAVVQQAATRIEEASAAGLRPAVISEPSPKAEMSTIQLGAYSSEAAARSAWGRVSQGAARSALSGLSPHFEAVEVNGRPLTRLKVSAPADTAVAICRAAQVTDPWCARRT